LESNCLLSTCGFFASCIAAVALDVAVDVELTLVTVDRCGGQRELRMLSAPTLALDRALVLRLLGVDDGVTRARGNDNNGVARQYLRVARYSAPAAMTTAGVTLCGRRSTGVTAARSRPTDGT